MALIRAPLSTLRAARCVGTTHFQWLNGYSKAWRAGCDLFVKVFNRYPEWHDRETVMRVEQIRSREGVMYYASKYVCKLDTEAVGNAGRFWGVHNVQAVPWAEVVNVPMNGGQAVRVMRVARRYIWAGQRTRPHPREIHWRADYGMTFFCEASWRLQRRPRLAGVRSLDEAVCRVWDSSLLGALIRSERVTFTCSSGYGNCSNQVEMDRRSQKSREPRSVTSKPCDCKSERHRSRNTSECHSSTTCFARSRVLGAPSRTCSS